MLTALHNTAWRSLPDSFRRFLSELAPMSHEIAGRSHPKILDAPQIRHLEIRHLDLDILAMSRRLY